MYVYSFEPTYEGLKPICCQVEAGIFKGVLSLPMRD